MNIPLLPVTTLGANTQDSIATRSSAPSSPRRSVSIEEVDDADARSSNVPPSHASRVVESSDGSNVEGNGAVRRKRQMRASSVINLNNGSSDEEPVGNETAEAERGMNLRHKSIGKHVDIKLSIQLALQKTGAHRFMPSSIQSRLLIILVTHLVAFMSSSATRSPVRARAQPGDTSGGILIPPMGSRQATFAATRSCAGVKRPLQGRTL